MIGYGNQGRSQALNPRDSGLDVRAGGQRDTTLTRAAEQGFATGDVAATVADSDVVLMLIPDEVMPEVFAKEVRPQLRVGACLDFASAYNVAFGLLEPPDHADVVMVAPRMIGPGEEDMLAQHEHHSHTSQYGSLSRGARFIDLDFRPRMEKVLEEIRSGAFAREWSSEQESGQPL